jgi:hypothetical protein
MIANLKNDKLLNILNLRVDNRASSLFQNHNNFIHLKTQRQLKLKVPTFEGGIMSHIMEIMGKTRVVIKDGEVIEVGEPELEWCPLITKLCGVQKITSEEVK